MNNTSAIKISNLSADGLFTIIKTYGAAFVIGWLLFERVRKSHPMFYKCRHRNVKYRNSLVEKEFSFLQWILPCVRMSDEELMEYGGFDSMMFLRFHKLCMKVALGGIVLSLFLFPVYGTEGRDEKKEDWSVLVMLSTSNLAPESLRYFATLAAAYAMTAYTMYLVLYEYQLFSVRKHELLRTPNAHQYSVLVDYLPKNLRSNATLLNYMNSLFPNMVRGVYVALEIKQLEKSVEERIRMRDNLEYYLAMEIRNRTRPMIRAKWWKCAKTVDAIGYYQTKLDDYNSLIRREITCAQRKQRERERKLQSPIHCKEVGSTRFTFQEKIKSPKQNADERSVIVLDSMDRQPAGEHFVRSSAFVSFKSLQAVQIAKQLVQTERPFSLHVSAAPPVDDTEWKNIGLSLDEKFRKKVIARSITVLVVIFWTIPVSTISNSLSPDSFIFKNLATRYPALKDLLEQLGPLFLLIANSLAAVIFRLIANIEGHPSKTRVEASVFGKLCGFQLIQIFFVNIVSGTILPTIGELFKQPQEVFKIIGSKIPVYSTFFCAYIVIQTGLKLTIELLRILPGVIALAHRIFAPRLTKRQRERAWLGLKPIAMPDEFFQAIPLANHYLVLLVMLIFIPMAPIIAYFGGFYFVVSDIVFRRQILFVHDPSPQSFGAFWPMLYSFIIVALLVSHTTIIGVLLLRRPQLAVFAVLLPICTIVYHHYVGKIMPKNSENLPLDVCCRLDKTRSQREDDCWLFLDSAYSQPALEESDPIFPENMPYLP